MPSSRLAHPFLSRDFTLLYLINICEFFASTLSRLCALQWLYEATGDVVALGLVGVVTLMCQLPSIALGGVLADVLPRAPLVANVQSVAALVAVLRWLLCAAGALSPAIIYLTIGMLECTKYLEGSARDVILPQVVSSDSLPHAVSIVMITKYAAEISAPFVFWALADAGGALTLAFFTAAVGFAACAVLPRLIRADTTPKSDEKSADGGLKRAGRDAAESVGMLGPSSDGTGPAGALSGAARTTSVAAASLTSRREHSLLGSSRREHPLLGSLLWLSRAWRSALVKMVEGVRYILSHPLLPGLYALDWGFTCVSYYRESSPCGSVSGSRTVWLACMCSPWRHVGRYLAHARYGLHACAHHGAMWVGIWLTHGVPVGLSSRGVVALLVVANFSGGMAGALGTLALNAYPYKGRLVLYATAGYGVACFLFGCSPWLLSGALTIFLMGAFDAVGATMRKQVVLLSTDDL